MKDKLTSNADTEQVTPHDAKPLLHAANVDLMNEILQRNYELFRLSVGLAPDEMSERAKEYFRKALEEYSQHQLKTTYYESE
jgi:hypothetical protein